LVKKDSKKKSLGVVYHAELYGKQKIKFEALDNATINNLNWKRLDYQEPYYFFVPKNFASSKDYEDGFKLSELFAISNTGIQTKRDSLTIHFNVADLDEAKKDLISLDEISLKKKYELPADGRDWTIAGAKKDVIENEPIVQKILYRPFDIRNTLYTGKTKGFLAYPRAETSKHLVNKENISLITLRLNGENERFVVLETKYLIEKGSLASGNYSFFPLYVYAEDGSKIPNLKKSIVAEIERVTGDTTPENILDYIYAVLHSPSYRSKYREFLKIDFPRVPYPKNVEKFRKLVEYGQELRELHLLESPKLNQLYTTYPESGSDKVESGYPKFKDNRVYINEKQYFGNVTEEIWNFYIGGYQPARKWLKDRRMRELSSEDIEHYQKLITALVETDRIMKQIDKIS
jgi:hypothetical protein